MFIGHYGVALAAKPVRKPIPLWLLFIAVQWLDILWSIFVMLGIEKVRIVKGFTQASDLDLYYMPYTHGLLGAVIFSLLLGVLAAAFIAERKAVVIAVVGGAAFSHWLLDLVVHVNDLPLLGDTMKVGFGLWRHVWISLPLELITLLAGAIVYARYIPSKTRVGDGCYWGFVVAMMGAEFYAAFGPAPSSPDAAGETALIGYLVIAACAAAVEWVRETPRLAPKGNFDRLAHNPISG